MQIDSHVHVWIHDPAYPWAPGAKPPPDSASAEQLLALMAAHGTEKTVLVQVIHYKWDNRYTADCLKRYPDRFEGVCRVDPESPTAADDLSRWVEGHEEQAAPLGTVGLVEQCRGDGQREDPVPEVRKRLRSPQRDPHPFCYLGQSPTNPNPAAAKNSLRSIPAQKHAPAKLNA